MFYNCIVFVLIAVCCIGQVGCASNKVVVAPAQPRLDEQLDNLYLLDNPRWRSKMEQLLMEDGSNLPPRHLIRAVDAFNTIETQKTCIRATYLYLLYTAQTIGSFDSAHHQLFSYYSEYVITHPSAGGTKDIKQLCRLVSDGICQNFN